MAEGTNSALLGLMLVGDLRSAVTWPTLLFTAIVGVVGSILFTKLGKYFVDVI